MSAVVVRFSVLSQRRGDWVMDGFAIRTSCTVATGAVTYRQFEDSYFGVAVRLLEGCRK